MFAAWNEADFDGLVQNTNPDAEYSPGIVVGAAAGERVIYRGHEELRRFFDEWHSIWKTEIAIDQIEEIEGGRVLVEGRMRMTGTKSGATVEQRAAWVGEPDEEGRLLRLWSYPSVEAAREAAS